MEPSSIIVIKKILLHSLLLNEIEEILLSSHQQLKKSMIELVSLINRSWNCSYLLPTTIVIFITNHKSVITSCVSAMECWDITSYVTEKECKTLLNKLNINMQTFLISCFQLSFDIVEWRHYQFKHNSKWSISPSQRMRENPSNAA